jgi:glycosyltransferase involved in cell wall biosynthesis
MLTVLLATRNGSRTLPGVLEALCNLESPSSGWKLVVVDNGSTDPTREIVYSFRMRLPVTYLFEGRLGKNVALNTGLPHLEGDLAVFTDDDVFPHSDWLVRMRAAADDHRLYSMFGGVVLPRWEAPPPHWVKWVPMGPVFTLTDPRMTDGPTDPWSVFGPNMAIRAEVFRSGICFDTSIGPRGSNYAMGSETELAVRLCQQGHKAWHVRDCIVEHFIRDYQMDKSWVLRRAIRFGRGRLRLSGTADSAAVQCLSGIPVHLFPELLKKGVKTVGGWLSLNEQAAFLARWEFNYHLGQVIEARLIRRQRCPHRDTDKEGQ